MAEPLPRHSLRRHLLALFAMLLLAGATVLVVDEYAQYRARQSLEALQSHSLGRLRALKAVSDGYNLGVVDTTFKVRNNLLGWDEGLAALDSAQAGTSRQWARLRAMPHEEQQQPLFAATALARVRADIAAAELRGILLRRDMAALGRFADTRLYPAVDPVVAGLQRLSDQAMVEAEAVVVADVRRGWATSALRIGLSALAFFVAVVAGRRVLGNAHRYEDALRESEARAREASRAKSAFLATMSHEIRTPMIGVTGMVEVLSRTRLDGEQRRALEVIETSAQSLLQIIGDILDFSKIEAGRLVLRPEALRLEPLLRATVATFAGAAAGKGLALVCKVDGRVAPAYHADALRLRQVLSNFLSNAIKFTDSGGVRVSLEWLGQADGAKGTRDRLRFQVADTGIGIPPEAQARLFQPFEQAGEDTSRRFGGTGLGLAICRRLADMMGGEVAMDSHPGIGTTLRLDVPLQRAPLSDVPADGANPDSPGRFAARSLPSADEAESEGSLVLLVDDHPTNRLVLSRQLALAGFASESAVDGEEGLSLWRSGRFALVLSDVHMPGLDGLAMAGRIRAEEAARALPRTPIVALTASALKDDFERCLAAGMDDYLAKPASIASLAGALHRWLPHVARDAAAEPPLPQSHPPAPLDTAQLDALTGGDAAEARLLFEDFLAGTAQDLALLEAARAGGELGAVAREAHKLRGAARMIGAPELAVASERLEAAASTGDWPQVAARAADVSAAVERLRRHVDRRYPAGLDGEPR